MTNYLNPEQWLNILDTISPFVSTSTERKQVINTFLPDMLDSGYSGLEALNLFRESNLGITTSTFYSIRRTILEDTNLVSSFRKMDLSDLVNESMLRVSSRILTDKYRFVAAYAIENSDTGEVKYGTWSYDTNQLGEKGDILNQILEDIKARYPLGNFDTLTANLRRGYIDLGK